MKFHEDSLRIPLKKSGVSMIFHPKCDEMDQLFEMINVQRTGLRAKDVVKQVAEKLGQAEETFLRCSEAPDQV